mmetsp:Transcript_22970/g.56773  ORF Transcript_22970/g.56773 Transcript_22970/m.56773 type:complete len:225 (-) Transcript_22970:383-1057(-)
MYRVAWQAGGVRPSSVRPSVLVAFFSYFSWSVKLASQVGVHTYVISVVPACLPACSVPACCRVVCPPASWCLCVSCACLSVYRCGRRLFGCPTSQHTARLHTYVRYVNTYKHTSWVTDLRGYHGWDGTLIPCLACLAFVCMHRTLCAWCCWLGRCWSVGLLSCQFVRPSVCPSMRASVCPSVSIYLSSHRGTQHVHIHTSIQDTCGCPFVATNCLLYIFLLLIK